MAIIDTLFITKTAKKHSLWARTYLYRPYKEVPPARAVTYETITSWDVLHETKQKRKQTLESAQYGLEIIFKALSAKNLRHCFLCS